MLLLASYAYLVSWTIPLIRFELGRAATFWAALWPFLRYGPDIAFGIALPIIVLVLFVRRHRAFPAACIAFFALHIVVPIFDHACVVVEYRDVFANRSWLFSDLAPASIGLARGLAFLVTWSIYLRRSLRVANTFK